jgi:hypothetical protein
MDPRPCDRGHIDDRAAARGQFLEKAARKHDRREEIDLEDVAPDMHRRVDRVHPAAVLQLW